MAAAANPLSYDVPLLTESDIIVSIQSGGLGDTIRHINLEQLKNPTCAMVLQLCSSILEKLGVDCDHYGQPLLVDVLSNPELFRSNIMFILNFTEVLNRSVPKLDLQARDILYPKWKQLRKFLSTTINYLRSWEQNLFAWEEISSGSNELLRRRDELLEQNAKLESVKQDVDAFLRKHENEFFCQREELEKLKVQFAEILQKQDKMHEEKAAAKKLVTAYAEELETRNAEYQKVLQEKSSVSALIVSSPDRQLAEHRALGEKLDVVKGECVEYEDKLREVERKVSRVRETHELIQYDLQQLSQAGQFIKSIQGLKDDLRKNQFETETRSLEMGKLRRETENLTQQLATQKEQLRRTKLRSEKQQQNIKQQLADANNDIKALQSLSKSKNMQIKAVLQQIETQDKLFKDTEAKHKENMDKLQQKEQKLQECLDKIASASSKYVECEETKTKSLRV